MIGEQWQTKPPPGTPINWSSPLAQSLAVAIPFNEASGAPIDWGSAGGNVWTSHGTPVPGWTSTQQGPGQLFVAVDDQYLVGPILSGMSQTTWSVGWVCTNTGAAGFAVCLG